MRLGTVAARLFVLCAAGLALAVPAALAGGAGMHPKMHPELAARLAGMGEHGVVNLQSQANKGKLCWTFELPETKGVTHASIHKGAKGALVVRLGKSYKRKGCTKASKMTLEHLEAAPRKYWVLVDTKGHPGDLRGRLFAGMAHM